MFASFGRSWEFAKMSYSLLSRHKHLILFPVISSIAGVMVMASFILPLWKMGILAEWWQFIDDDTVAQGDVTMYVTAFLFYFCTYFTIVFFNTGLIACVLKLINGEDAPVSYGLSFAMKRLPQIIGWALVSAVIGVLLKAVENSNRKAGRFISAILGSAWSAMTYFVLPVIVLDGVGPIEAFKRSLKTLKTTWGTALTGNFSLGLISLLFMIPVLLISFALVYLGIQSGSPVMIIAAFLVSILLVVTMVAVTSTADVIFRTYLFTYATGNTLPADVDTSQFASAFKQKR